jgi:hypothetical protein
MTKQIKVVTPRQYQRIVGDFKTLLCIDNSYRSPFIVAELKKLITTIDQHHFHPALISLIEYYNLAANWGVGNRYLKTYLSTHCDDDGIYDSNRGEIYLRRNDLSVLLHEIVHAVIDFIWNSEIPPDHRQWWELTHQLLAELTHRGSAAAYEIFVDLLQYPELTRVRELLCFLVEFIPHIIAQIGTGINTRNHHIWRLGRNCPV